MEEKEAAGMLWPAEEEGTGKAENPGAVEWDQKVILEKILETMQAMAGSANAQLEEMNQLMMHCLGTVYGQHQELMREVIAIRERVSEGAVLVAMVREEMDKVTEELKEIRYREISNGMWLSSIREELAKMREGRETGSSSRG